MVDYKKEPFDFKLFMLKMLGKWYWFAASLLAGSLLFGCSYYLYKVVYAPAREFQASATYYIEYVNDPVLDSQYSFFNQATLNSWLSMDEFTEPILEKLGEDISKEMLAAAVSLDMPSDVRVVRIKVVTAEKNLTMDILKAYDEVFVQFGEVQREINVIRRQDISKEAVQIKADIRTQRAFVLGGVLGLFIGSMYMILQYLLDDGIYLPGTLAKRHGLWVFGTDASEELAANIIFAIAGKKRVAITCIGESPALTEVQKRLQSIAGNMEWVMVPPMVQCPEAGEILRGCEGCILTVVSGKDKSAAIDRAMRYYKQQGAAILGAVLWDADVKLLNRYEK